ncbi:SDR family NAD(P)-dependent oxidoreductase, partial [Streptomyces rubiginosohelvolus]
MPARRAIRSMVVPAGPRAANSSVAACRRRLRVCSVFQAIVRSLSPTIELEMRETAVTFTPNGTVGDLEDGMEFKDSRVVVIGGTSGLGFATASAAAREGASVVVASANRDRVDQALAQLPE